MDDEQVRQRIEALVAEEHRLWDAEAAGSGSNDDRRRLDELKISLDQCWDLLRQRRALEAVREGSRRRQPAQRRDRRELRAVRPPDQYA